MSTRPEIWRLAKYLNGLFGSGDSGWAAADKHGWYDRALQVHNEVYRNNSPHVRHYVPTEAMTEVIETMARHKHCGPSTTPDHLHPPRSRLEQAEELLKEISAISGWLRTDLDYLTGTDAIAAQKEWDDLKQQIAAWNVCPRIRDR